MKKPFLLFILLLLLTAPVLVFATTTVSIVATFPGMGPVTTSTQPGNYVRGFYLFALTVGGVLALGAIVYGGILYAASAGDPSKQSEGREWIWSALIGLLLLAGAYIVLYTINPDLVNLTLPQLTMINIPTSTSSSGPGNGTQPCYPPSSGACSHANNLSCFGGQAAFMQNVCDVESRGNAGAPSGVDIGADNNPVSYGLFQINISANYMVNPATGQKVPCPNAFSGGAYTAKNHNTAVKTDSASEALFQQCVKLAEDPSANIATACAISNNGANLGPWKSDCGL